MKTEHIHPNRSVNVTLGNGTGTERGREIIVRGSVGRERGRGKESGNVRRSGCAGKKSGRGTG